MIYRRGDAKVLAGRVDGDADRVSRPLLGVPVREELGDSMQVRRRGVRGEGEVVLVDGGSHEALLVAVFFFVVVFLLKFLLACENKMLEYYAQLLK